MREEESLGMRPGTPVLASQGTAMLGEDGRTQPFASVSWRASCLAAAGRGGWHTW